MPKVIDFDIAKATEGRLTDATVYTQLNQFIGTPAYMSPEQVEMSELDIDTRSDIYRLSTNRRSQFRCDSDRGFTAAQLELRTRWREFPAVHHSVRIYSTVGPSHGFIPVERC